MPIDLALLIAATAATLAAGVWYLLVAPRTDVPRATIGCTALAYAGGASLLAGLGWRGIGAGVWPGATAEGALLLIATGALLLFVWLRGRVAPQVCGLGLLGAGLTMVAALTVAAIMDEFGASTVAPAAQTAAWPFGVRGALMGIGLGGWLWVLAADVWAWPRRRTSEAHDAPPTDEAEGDASAAQPAMDDTETGPTPEIGAPAGNGTRNGEPTENADAPSAASPAIDPAAEDAADDAGRLALTAAYPWLTLALLAAAAWNLAAYAVAWRGTPADIWLLIAWLVATAYLHGSGGYRPAPLGRRRLAVLAIAGLAAATMAAVQAASLFW
jgi:hypothetical protein